MLPGKISNVVGEVQLAVQLFTKGDRVILTDQEVGDAAEAQVCAFIGSCSRALTN